MTIKRPEPKQSAPNAKRVFQGLIFDVYHWKQKMYDGNFDTFEKIKRIDTVNVIPVTADGKILLLRQNQPGFKTPCLSVAGGKIDKGETPIQAAERELLEETGYRAKKMELWFSVQPHMKVDWAVYTFIARGCEKVAPQKLENGEDIKLKPVSFEEFIKIAFTGNFYDKEIVLRLLKEGINWQTCFKSIKTVKNKFIK